MPDDETVLQTEEATSDSLETEISVEVGSDSLSSGEPLEVVIVDDSPSVLAINGTAYNGSISTTYLEYFRGYVQKMGHDVHYLLYRVDNYNYRLLYGTDLLESDGYFTGSVDYVNIYTRDGTYISTGSDSVSVSTGTAMVYSDYVGYSSLTEGGTSIEFKVVLFVLCFMVAYNVLHDIFDYCMSLFHK